MKIIEKLAAKEHDMYGKPPVTIAFLGDSVTHGCFEVYRVGENGLDTVFEAENSFSHKVKTILHTLFPRTQINVIGAGISGDNATGGLSRLERDVLPYHPDLTVVCFGLNDSCGGPDGLTRYHDSLTAIIEKLRAADSEVILMTPNTMCFHTSPHCRDPFFVRLAEQFAEIMHNGTLDRYMDAARAVARETDTPLCDVYRMWQIMEKAGVDTTELLANSLNHPTRELHWLFADELVKTMFR